MIEYIILKIRVINAENSSYPNDVNCLLVLSVLLRLVMVVSCTAEILYSCAHLFSVPCSVTSHW